MNNDLEKSIDITNDNIDKHLQPVKKNKMNPPKLLNNGNIDITTLTNDKVNMEKMMSSLFSSLLNNKLPTCNELKDNDDNDDNEDNEDNNDTNDNEDNEDDNEDDDDDNDEDENKKVDEKKDKKVDEKKDKTQLHCKSESSSDSCDNSETNSESNSDNSDNFDENVKWNSLYKLVDGHLKLIKIMSKLIN